MPKPTLRHYVKLRCRGLKGGETMTACLFRSPLASRLQSFSNMRNIPGRNRESERKILTYIDRFLMGELKIGDTITYDILNRWIKEMEYLSVGTRINRLSSVISIHERALFIQVYSLGGRAPHLTSTPERRSALSCQQQSR